MNDLYKISRERLENIADRVRAIAGLTRKLTPAEIVYWLERVKFTPSSVGESEFTLNFASTAAGRLPDVAKGNASSNFNINFATSAIGVLPDVVKGMANSEFMLDFETSAVGALQEE